MKNLRIERIEQSSHCERYVVKGDSERFGIDAILYESYSLEQCEAYIIKNGGTAKVTASKVVDNAKTVKSMKSKGFKVTEKSNGNYVVDYKLSGKLRSVSCKNFCYAADFVWNMANTKEIGAEVNHRMCAFFGKRCI